MVEAAVHRINVSRKGQKAQRDHSFTPGKTRQVLSQLSGDRKIFYKEKEGACVLCLLWGWSEFGGCQ